MEKTVFFRAFEEEDADLIYKWMNDDELKKMSVGVNHRMCRTEALEWVRNRMYDSRERVFFAICAIDTGKMIGYMSLSDIHYINSCGNFSGILIGDKQYQDGFAWIEAYLFMYEYAFERLNLNRIYGYSIEDQTLTRLMSKIMFATDEGILRKATYKNGQFHNLVLASLLKDEYMEHKKNNDYEFKAILNRIRKMRKSVQ